MLSEQSSIDDLFRKKEADLTPGTFGQDAHWLQMKAMLATPGNPPPRKRIRKIMRRRLISYAGGVAVIAIIVTVTVLNTGSGKKALSTKTSYKHQPAAIQSISHPMPVKRTTATVPFVTPYPQATPSTGGSNRRLPVKTSAVPDGATTDAVPRAAATAVATAKKNRNAAEILQQFYSELQPQPQEFAVRTDHDTTLLAKEGTRLIIPARAFVSKEGYTVTGIVKIVVEEYYSYDKMLAAGLGTTSNGEQLVSGGMLNIKAESEGKPLQLAPSISMTVKMPTANYDSRMQLFTGNLPGNTPSADGIHLTQVRTMKVQQVQMDTPATGPVVYSNTVRVINSAGVGTVANNSSINWVAAGQWEVGYRRPSIRVWDMRNAPSNVSYGRKTSATFSMNDDSKFTTEEIKAELEKRYSYYYDRIKVKRVTKTEWTSLFSREVHTIPIVGDSVDMSFEDAIKNKLISKKDSITWIKKAATDSIRYFAMLKTRKEYTFSVKNLGWINCDRFSDDRGPKVEFTLNLGAGYDARNFQSELVFTRYRSVMTGYYAANKLLFSKIPENEPVQLICVGVKDGKVLTCIQPLTVSAHEVNNLVFEETTPEQFRQKLRALNLSAN